MPELVPDERMAEYQARLRRVEEEARGGRLTHDFETPAADYSEDLIAQRLVDNYGAELRYCAEWRHWLQWDGVRWSRDRVQTVRELARRECRWAAADLGMLDEKAKKLERTLNSASTISAVERIAQSDRRVVSVPEEWDCNPYALNCPEGTVDLRTGERRPATPLDCITKVAGATPDAGGACRRWGQFLAEITCDDEDLAEYLRRLVGYWLTGDIRDPVLAFFIGHGGNGKSVLLSVLRHVFGDYARVIPSETLMEARGERHPTELANLQGVRLAICNEVEEGRRWSESRVKSLTGDEMVSARFMRGDFFEFRRTHKHVVAGNHRPALGVIDAAIRRRLHIIPFRAKFDRDQADPGLTQKLLAEAPAILAWAVQGALEWQEGGLRPPASVVDASEEYFADQDILGQWLAECCDVTDPTARIPSSEAYRSFKRWKEARNEHPPCQVRFAEWMRGRFRKVKTAGANVFEGLQLVQADLAAAVSTGAP